MNYYDTILGLIPVVTAGVAYEPVAPVAGTISLALVAHALFVNPPTNLSTLHPKE